MRVYLDVCCFNRPFDEQSQLKIRLETEAKIYVQQKIIDGMYELVWSYVMDYENSLNPFLERRHRIGLWKGIAKIFCNENEIILTEAEKLRRVGVKFFDSLHVACSIFLKAERKLDENRHCFES